MSPLSPLRRVENTGRCDRTQSFVGTTRRGGTTSADAQHPLRSPQTLEVASEVIDRLVAKYHFLLDDCASAVPRRPTQVAYAHAGGKAFQNSHWQICLVSGIPDLPAGGWGQRRPWWHPAPSCDFGSVGRTLRSCMVVFNRSIADPEAGGGEYHGGRSHCVLSSTLV